MNIYYKNDYGKLYHGDCLEVMELLSVISNPVDMILCDPPYGTTRNKWDSVIPLNAMWGAVWPLTKINAAVVITAQTPFDKILGASCISNLKYEWIWKKESGSGHLNAKKAPLKNHENALVFYRLQPTYNPQMREGYQPYRAVQGKTKSSNYGLQTGAVIVSGGERYPLTTIEFLRDREKLHPTQKPVALFEYLVKTYTNEGETVLDFCAGSGTTAVAAQNTGRRWICIEKEEKYCEIIVNRIEKLDNQRKLNFEEC